MEITPVVDLITAIGVPGVLAWYLWYDTAVARPKRQDAESLQIEKLASHYNGTMERVCNNFTVSLRDERDTRVRELQMLRDELRYMRGVSDTHRDDREPPERGGTVGG